MFIYANIKMNQKQNTLKNQETLTNEQIKQYIDQLVSFYGLCEPIQEKALAILFEQNLFGECLRQVMRYMRLKTRIKITYFFDHAYKCDESLGYVEIPPIVPFIGTPAFKEMLFEICAKSEAKQNVYRLIYMFSHELSHIILHGSNHPLKYSEMATDLCAFVFGFENFIIKARCQITITPMETKFSIIGYLSAEQMLFASLYLKKLRKKVARKRKITSIVQWFKSLLLITPRKSA